MAEDFISPRPRPWRFSRWSHILAISPISCHTGTLYYRCSQTMLSPHLFQSRCQNRFGLGASSGELTLKPPDFRSNYFVRNLSFFIAYHKDDRLWSVIKRTFANLQFSLQLPVVFLVALGSPNEGRNFNGVPLWNKISFFMFYIPRPVWGPFCATDRCSLSLSLPLFTFVTTRVIYLACVFGYSSCQVKI